MNISRLAIIGISCLVVYAVCLNASEEGIGNEDDLNNKPTGPDEDGTKNSTATTPSTTGQSVVTEHLTDPTETSSTEADSSEGSTEKDAMKSTIDTSEDILITGTAVPGDEGGSGEITEANTDQSPTIYDDDVTTVSEETNRTACWSNPCRNGGTCVEDSVIPLLFSCICPTGYVGIRCGTKDACVQGHDGELCENGACVHSDDGLLRYCHCFTGTYWGEEMKECREPDPPCFPNPCMNGGTCSGKDDRVLCDCASGFQGHNCSVQDKCGDCERGTCVLDDKRTTKYCRCDEGLYWNDERRSCEEMVSPCDSSPCLNGGSCDATSDTEYNCTCEPGFSGRTCDVVEKCSTREDCGQGACVLSEDKTMRTCHCDKGFYLEERSHKCEEITNICQSNPCLHDGICTVVSSGVYNCTCSSGYTGPRCEVRDLCKIDGGDAYCRNGRCDSNSELGVYFCVCEDEQYFQYSKRTCVELDLCPLVDCSSSELCSMGTCECKENYKWDNTTKKCKPDFCSSNPCPLEGMVCEEGTGSTDYKCSCQEGYAFNGTHCNVASCVFPSLNSCNQICSPVESGYECSCNDDFELKGDNHTCLYVGNSTCSNKTCDRGFCVKENGMELCLCPPGYTEEEGKCIDVCSESQLAPGVCPLDECEVAKEGGFRCKCEGKFAHSKDGATCTVRNVCREQELGWKTCRDRNAECVEDWESKEGFICQCARGQVTTEGGVCRDICSLENNQRQCSIKGATCDVDEEGRMVCRCPPYFKENERDGKCTQPADFSYLVTLPLDKSTYQVGNGRQRSMDTSLDHWKISRDITVTIRETFAEFKRATVLSCKLATGSDVILCKVEIQFANEHWLDLKRLQTEEMCLTNGNSRKCLIPPSLVLVKDRISKDVAIQPTDPCDEDISNFVCGSETTCISSIHHKSFNCSCKPGFFARRKNYPFGNTRSFIEICADIDECAESDPCPANSICTNTIGNYTCSCKPGFRNVVGASGMKCVEICNPNPCMHGECSRRGDHSFDCKCEAGYRGSICNLQDENFKNAKTNTIIVGVVLGGILLITFILFAACISRIRKQKILENSGRLYYNSAEMTERRRVEGGAVNNAFQRE